jgi:lysophospholipase L1-like esterase
MSQIFTQRVVIVAFVCAAVIACGSRPPTPIEPSAPTAAAPQILCPADMSAVIHGGSTSVAFFPPTVTGGNAPVGFTCTPASGASFSLGTTPVSCVAFDAAGLSSAPCGFNVKIAGVQLGVKKFEAIGDSLTEGENGISRVQFTDEPNSYPTKLRERLEAEFPAQGIVMINRGAGGQRFGHANGSGFPGTLDVLPGYLAADAPEAVLIVGGYNHLTVACAFGRTADDPGCAHEVEGAEDALREVIQIAKTWPGVRYVYVATMTPPGPVAEGAPHDRRIDPSAIADLNDRIRFSTAAGGAILVDVAPLFVGHEAEYVSVDGLHLRPAGYLTIANLFYSRIIETVPQSNPARSR